MEYKFLKSWRSTRRIEMRICEWFVLAFGIHRDFPLEIITSILSSGDAAAIFNGGSRRRSYCNFCLVQSKCQFHPASGVIGSLCTRPSEESRNFHVNFLFFSWPHVTVRATLARVDDTALAAIDRDGWNAKLGEGWYAPRTSRFLQEGLRN